MISSLCILFSIFLIFSFVFIFRKKIIYDIFEPPTLFAGFLILFFFNNAFLFDYNFSYLTGFVILFGTISFLFGFYILPSSKYKLPEYIPSGITLNKYIFYSIVLSFSNFIILLIKVKAYGFTLEQYLGAMLLFHAENIKEGGYVWLALTKPINFAFLIVSFSYVYHNRTIKAIIFVFIMYALFKLSSLSVSRWHYIQVILFIILLYSRFIVGRPKFKIVYIFPLLFIPPLMIILNSFRHGRSGVIDGTLFQAGLDSLKGDSNPGRNFDYFINYVFDYDLFHHGWFVITQFFSIIPRVIWHDKPITSSLFYYTKKVFELDPISDGVTYTFTVFDFTAITGFSSLICGMIFFGWFSKTIYNAVYFSKNSLFFSFSVVFLLNYINTLRGSFLDQISFFILDAIVLIFIYYFVKIKNQLLRNFLK